MTEPDWENQDRTDFCNVCGQHYTCANCTATKCNYRGERPHERHMLQGRDRHWDIEVESTWDWIEEGQS
jgi:hypothetical protein